MKDPDKIWEEANALKNDRYKWKMGLNHKDCNKEEFVQKMEKTYKYLKESSSTIFNNIIDEDNIEMDKLKYMLDMMRSMGEKKTTYEHASKEVGQRFADEYIKPLVDKLENEKKEKENMEQEKNDNKTSIEELEEVD
uniref:Uncharacterized protein n=1 Tax=viral metagenome TaxID=1070528 RepID=A0A6C0EFE9_9ZZZZ